MELLKEYDAKHGIEVSSQVPQVEKGEDSGTNKQTRKRQKTLKHTSVFLLIDS